MDSEDFLEIAYRKYTKDLFAYGMTVYPDSEAVEDAIHDVFIWAYQHREKLRKVNNLKYYLMAAIRRNIIRQAKAARQAEAEPEAAFDLHEERDALDSMIESEDRNAEKELLDKVFSSLNPRHSELLFLRFTEGLSFEEIGNFMHINRQSAQNLFQKIIGKLRKEVIIK
ncbi:MAG: sigma-70 family RNA polymerase sigma factor [Prevotella sp.]|jgi:RNA polymerase sigma factor (sigma-70 family)|nr:sigma-70 family RNA polymerase sigma factor [Prevotella sp.]